MLKRSLVALAVLAVLFGLTACSKKEKEEKAAASEPAKPAINPEEMVYVQAGDFIMGTDSKDPLDALANPQHKVNLPAFYIDRYEITNNQFLDFSIKTSYEAEGIKEGKDWHLFFAPEKGLFPVVYITWKDASEYCKSIGKRLPTEEEWEKAARGPNGNAYPWGNEWMDGKSNTAEAGFRNPGAIGQFEDTSFYGVHDMLGNVQEWTGSWYSTYKGNPKKDPKSGEKYRVARGLSSRFMGKRGHLWNRIAFPPTALYDTGCRCAKDATAEDIAKEDAKPKK
jgi:formylglycine-generating enzyme required for sulfatase activity